jgi:hypothetical protein
VAELVDALVSGTSAHKAWRLESSPGHHDVISYLFAALHSALKSSTSGNTSQDCTSLSFAFVSTITTFLSLCSERQTNSSSHQLLASASEHSMPRLEILDWISCAIQALDDLQNLKIGLDRLD